MKAGANDYRLHRPFFLVTNIMFIVALRKFLGSR